LIILNYNEQKIEDNDKIIHLRYFTTR
jgi:hypothetical protein